MPPCYIQTALRFIAPVPWCCTMPSAVCAACAACALCASVPSVPSVLLCRLCLCLFASVPLCLFASVPLYCCSASQQKWRMRMLLQRRRHMPGTQTVPSFQHLPWHYVRCLRGKDCRICSAASQGRACTCCVQRAPWVDGTARHGIAWPFTRP